MKVLIVITAVVFSVIACTVATQKAAPLVQLNAADSIAKINLAYVNEILASIKGKENTRVDSVFQNIQSFKGAANFKAAHFVKMMNGGWSKALGVTCNHCHNPADWASDEKPAKLVARQMWTLREKLDKQIFPEMGIKTHNDNGGPPISCNTCHNGKIIPLNN